MTTTRAAVTGVGALLAALTLCMAPGLVPAAWAQQLTGTVQGIVSDAQGGVLPGATVELSARDTGSVSTRTTGPDGAFVFNAVRPGPHTIKATLQGFKGVARELTVNLNLTVQANFTLELGDMKEEVVVRAEQTSVELVRAQVSLNLDGKTIVDLPNINRDITTLVELIPGVRPVQGSTSGGSQVVDISGNFALGNGTRRSQSLFYVDGSENMGARRNQALQMPNPDTIEQVQILASSASAEFGKQPGISVNAITKSGTNTLHGTAFYASHFTSLNTRTWAAENAGSPKPEDTQKWWGGTAGGPIVKNRTFFFASYQRYQDNPKGENLSRMPTPKMLQGDFSDVAGFSIRALDPLTNQPIGTVIPSRLINPIAAELAMRFPTIEAYNNVLRYYWPIGREVYNNEILGKVDHKLTPSQQIAVTYMTTKGAQIRPDGFPGLENAIPGWGGIGTSDAQQHTISARHQWVTSPSMVVESRFAMGYLKSTRARSELDENIGTLGGIWPEVTPGVEKTLPSIFLTNGPSGRGGQLSDTVQENYRFVSTATWVRGNHNVKFGGEFQNSGFRRFLNYDNGQVFFTGQYSFTNRVITGPWPSLSTPTGDNTFAYAWADFLMGRVNQVRATGVSDNDMRGNSAYFFMQDDWRLHPRLTISPGLRYEVYGAQRSKVMLAGYVSGHRSDQYSNTPLGLAFEGDTGIPQGFREADKNNIAPRIGAAWNIRGDGTLALKAGGGVYYAYPPLAQLELLADTVGATTITGTHTNLTDAWGGAKANSGDTVCQFPGCTAPSWTPDPATRVFVPVSVNGLAPELETPWQYQFNATLQWQAVRNLVLEGGYVGNRPQKGFVVTDQNLAVWAPGASTGNLNARRPDQLWRSINVVSNDAIERYDAAEFSATYRTGRIYAMGYYIVRRSLSTGDDDGQEVGISNAAGDWTDNPRDIRAELAPVASRQQWRVAFAVDLPGMKSHPKWDYVLGGWQISGNFSGTDGDRLNVTIGGDYNVDGFGSDRPNEVGPINYVRQKNDDGSTTWIDRSAFGLPPLPSAENPYPFGTLSRNAVRGPIRFFSDMALSKNFSAPKTTTFQLRFEANNVFDYANLSNPNLTLSSTDFGIIRTRTGGGRTMQVQLKYIF